MYSPNDVFNAIARIEGKKALTHSTRKSEVGLIWVEAIRESVDVCFKAATLLENGTSAAAGIDKALRHATHGVAGKMLPPFVSAGYVRSILEPAWFEALCHAEQGAVFEHVVPLKSTLSGNAFLKHHATIWEAPALQDAPATFTLMARSLLTPTCTVLKHEDKRLPTYLHPNWRRPFLRYAEANRDFPKHEPIRIFSTATGREVDLDTFTWFDYEHELSASPAYAPALEFVRSLPAYIAEHHAAPLEALMLRSVAVSPAKAMARSKGFYSRDEREHLADLAHELAASLAPMTVSGRLAIEIPVNRDRLSIDLLHPQPGTGKPIAARINIGPERSKFELYHVSKAMHAGGRAMFDALAEALKQRGFDVPITTEGNMQFYSYGKTISAPHEALAVFLAAAAALYEPAEASRAA